MGGKGQRRREKNYRAAHGGYNRLPPPPDPSLPDALPSKLRKIIAMTSSATTTSWGSMKRIKSSEQRGIHALVKKKHGEAADEVTEVGAGSKVQNVVPPNNDRTPKKKTHKRKRAKTNDLQFIKGMEELCSIGLKRRDRKKKFFEEKKKRKKVKKSKEGADNHDFRRHEKIQFGDVVEAPPTLKVVPKPKAFKEVSSASRERLRLQAVESYRNRKGWVSRPGINLPFMPFTSING